MSTNQRKPPKQPVSTRPSGSGRPAGDYPSGSRLVRGNSGRLSEKASVTSEESVPRGFNVKEATEFLQSRLEQAKAEGSSVFVYQGEQRAWGSRSLIPHKDDFLQLVEVAIDKLNEGN
jgi:hypothetical protein